MEPITKQPRLLVVWHSRTSASEQLARAAAEGAAQEVSVDIARAQNVTEAMVVAARVYLFVCPENLGSMSGAMKEFFDCLYYPLLGRIEGRAYATVVAAGSDGAGAQRQIDRIVTGWRLKRVADPMIANLDAQTPDAILAPKRVPKDTLQKARDLGKALGCGCAMGVF